jgi:hypothetical protein
LEWAGVDSGGGISSIGAYTNHGSIGEFSETKASSAGSYGVFVGLIEVLYVPMPVDPDLDSDGNGLPDAWEEDNFGTVRVDPDGDADQDGTTNEMEFLAMTDPRDPSSVFRPAAYRDGDFLVVPVQTANGRTYNLWGGSDLQEWFLIDTVPGDGTEVLFSYDTSAAEALPYFLRIEVLKP